MKKVYRLLILAAVVLLWGQMLEARAEGPGDDPNFVTAMQSQPKTRLVPSHLTLRKNQMSWREAAIMNK